MLFNKAKKKLRNLCAAIHVCGLEMYCWGSYTLTSDAILLI